MTTGPEHYAEAESYLKFGLVSKIGDPTTVPALLASIAHALLALAAATALNGTVEEVGGMHDRDRNAWERVCAKAPEPCTCVMYPSETSTPWHFCPCGHPIAEHGDNGCEGTV